VTLEDRLRASLTRRATAVQASPDPDDLSERTTRARVRRSRVLVTAGIAALVAVAAGGVAVGAAIAGPASSQSAGTSPTSTTAGGAGAAAGPDTEVAPGPTAGGVTLTPLFQRTTGAGVDIRAYGETSTTTPVCTGGNCTTPSTTSTTNGTVASTAPCPSTPCTSTPLKTPPTLPIATGCPTNTVCVQPLNHAVAGASPSTSSGAPSGSSSPQGTTLMPSCQLESVLLELSNAAAVGTATVSVPLDPGLAPNDLVVEDSGSFGTAESSPSGWVLVDAASNVVTVRLDGGAGGTDEMAPVNGVVVLALPVADLSGDTIDALDAAGTVLSSTSVPPSAAAPQTPSCLTTSTTASTTTTTSTMPTTAPSTTTTTTGPVAVTPSNGTGPPTTIPLPPGVGPAGGLGR